MKRSFSDSATGSDRGGRLRFREHRSGDTRRVRRIAKWLNAGVRDGTDWTDTGRTAGGERRTDPEKYGADKARSRTLIRAKRQNPEFRTREKARARERYRRKTLTKTAGSCRLALGTAPSLPTPFRKEHALERCLQDTP